VSWYLPKTDQSAYTAVRMGVQSGKCRLVPLRMSEWLMNEPRC